MSEVKRYAADEQYPGQYSARCDLVPASDYDTALSQLAALREELENEKARIPQYISERALAEQRLANADPNGSFDKHMQYMQENIHLKQRLADAERRNVDISILLREAFDAGDIQVFGSDLHDRLEAALNKPEEAKS